MSENYIYILDPSKDLSEHHNLPAKQLSTSKYVAEKYHRNHASRNKFKGEDASLDQIIKNLTMESIKTKSRRKTLSLVYTFV